MRLVPDPIAERLGAAAGVFAERGFDQTRIEDLADATGVPRATLYYYFSGKEDILAWLLRRALGAMAEAVEAAAAGPGPARARLEAVLVAHLRLMAEQPDCCRALAADHGRAARIPEIAGAIESAFHAPVRDLLGRGSEDGSLRAVGDPETAASAIYGAVTMAGLHHLVTGNRLDAPRVAGEVCRLLFHGLATGSRTRNSAGSGRAPRGVSP